MVTVRFEQHGHPMPPIAPGQQGSGIRVIQSDHKGETLLEIYKEEQVLAFTIVHYSSNMEELMRSSTWVLHAKQHGLALEVEKPAVDEAVTVSIQRKIADYWVLTGSDKVQLHIEFGGDKVISLWVVNPAERQTRFDVPEFRQVPEGAAPAFYIALEKIIEQLRTDFKHFKSLTSHRKKELPYYIELERLYETLELLSDFHRGAQF